jgi:hypothetical protein
MRFSSVAILIAAVGISMSIVEHVSAADQTPAPCASPAHGQFDFWVGSWSVTDRNSGKIAGNNKIEKILNGCALLESWTGASGHRGHSLNFYDAARDRWHQTWIDVAGEPLYLDGRFIDGAMILEGVSPGGKGEAELRHRITWSQLDQGGLRQHWQSSKDGGATWTDVFDGIYSRAR